MEKEIFKQIKFGDKETIYAVSNKGRVMNTKRKKMLTPNFKSRRKPHALKDNEPNNMYVEYALFVDGKYYFKLAHRLVAEYFIPVPERYLESGLTMDDLVVDHKDDIRYHNTSDNLQWLTQAENHDKMMTRGRNRIAYGSNHGMCNYTDEQLNMVGKLFEENVLTKHEIAEVTGIPYKTICSISTGKKFSYLHDIYDFSKYNRKNKSKYNSKSIKLAFMLLEDPKYSIVDISNITKINYSDLNKMITGELYNNISKHYDLSKRTKKKI